MAMSSLPKAKTLIYNPVIRYRYLQWLVTRALHGRPPFVCLPQGRRVLPASRFNDFHAIATQHPEAPEFCLVDALLALTGQGAFFDVGANVGVMSVVASSTGRASPILAFEPSHRYCSAWHTNMALNGVENATLIQAAVGDRCDRINFRVDPAMPLHGKIDAGLIYPTKHIQQVQMFTLDAIYEISAINSIALLKIDVEGAEPLVIRGAKNLLKARLIKSILFEFIVEFIEDLDEDPHDFVRTLTEAGFALHAIASDGAIGRQLDPAAVVDERRVAPEAPPRPFHEINLVAIRH
jgi:FkbM family methyltransferase